MKQLEDRIKERLEGYESSLPEGDLAEFKALLGASSTAGAKRSPVYLAWLAPIAVAAGLALFFAFGHDSRHDIIQVADVSSQVDDAAPASPADVADLPGTEPVEYAVVVPTKHSSARKTMHTDATASVNEETENKDAASGISEQITSNQSTDEQVMDEQSGGDKRKDESSSVSSLGHSPFIPSSNRNRKPVSVKVGRATAGVLGGTGAIVLASVLPSILMNYDSDYVGPMYDPVDPGGIIADPEPFNDSRTCDDTHHLPLHTGLSVRIPFNQRWSVSTGLDYVWYASELGYSLSGIHKQSVHYLGIPLRADFTIARNRWMDVYAGAGGSADLCVAAYDAGQKITRDGVGFSLIGSGGIQFNISKNLGLFLEPTFSWNIPSGYKVLDTYRTENPFMLAVSSGLRFTIQE